MGRHKLPPGEARTNTIRIRLTEAERAELDAAALRDGEEVSAWARAVLLDAVRTRPRLAARKKPRRNRSGGSDNGLS